MSVVTSVARSSWLLLSLLFALTVLLAPLQTANAYIGAGAGTEENPYMVANCEELQDVENDLDGYYVQTGNIDCSDSEEWNSGEGFVPIGQDDPFTGTYDGQNFTINDLFINPTASVAVGLFKQTNGATIKQTHLRDGTIDSDNGGYNGTLASSATNTDFSDCSSTAAINAVAQAGLVGYMSGGTMSRCWYEGSIDADDNGYTAGLVAVASAVDFTDVYTQGTLIGETYSGALIGGLDGGTLTNAYSSMNVTSTATTYSGGLTGYMSDQGVGGGSPNLAVSNVFFGGSFTETASNAGAITSFIDNTDFTKVYYDQDTCGCTPALGSGTPDSGSVTAVNTDGSAPNYFKGNNTNEPMASWDFDDVWQVNAGDFPTLQMGSTPVDSDDDGVSNEIENAGPNGGDADGSGVLDSAEPYSASMVNPETGEYSVLVVTETCSIISLTIVAEDEVTSGGDVGYEYPGGFMDFRINCNATGFTATISQLYYGVDDGNYTVRKYTPSQGFFDVGADVTQDEIGGTPVMLAEYRVTDGTNYDIDGLEDGFIEDPAGLASGIDVNEQLADTGVNHITTILLATFLVISGATILLKITQRGSVTSSMIRH